LIKAGFILGFLLIIPGKSFSFPQRVKEIRIEGVRSLDKSTILNWIDLKPGGELDSEIVSQDIKRIYSTGLVEDVVVEKEPVAGERFALRGIKKLTKRI